MIKNKTLANGLLMKGSTRTEAIALVLKHVNGVERGVCRCEMYRKCEKRKWRTLLVDVSRPVLYGNGAFSCCRHEVFRFVHPQRQNGLAKANGGRKSDDVASRGTSDENDYGDPKRKHNKITCIRHLYYFISNYPRNNLKTAKFSKCILLIIRKILHLFI